MTGFLCSTPLYEYEHNGKVWTFEMHRYMGTPWPIRKDGAPYKRAGKTFWDMLDAFMALPEDEQETYRIGGGCQRF